MITFLSLIISIGLILQFLIGLSFFISSIFEKEKRASIFGIVQLIGMMVPIAVIFYFFSTGFFDTKIGAFILILLTAICAFLVITFFKKTGINQKALKGTAGYITGAVERFDERDHVFSRNRT